jgi:hypothetical protein
MWRSFPARPLIGMREVVLGMLHEHPDRPPAELVVVGDNAGVDFRRDSRLLR